MYLLDDDLFDALGSASVQPVARLTALWPDGSFRREWALRAGVVQSGTVTDQLRRDVRRDASMAIINHDGGLSPVEATDLFARGSRLRVERGAIVGTAPVYATLMTGFVTGCRASMRGVLNLTAESHMSALQQDLGESLTLPAGTFLVDALHALWDPVLPWVEWVVSIAAYDRAIGSAIPVLASDSRLDTGLGLARDLGCVAYDDRDGRIVVDVRPDPSSSAPVRTMAEPVDLDRDSGLAPFNGQAVESTVGEQEPFHVLEIIDDPSSPIHPGRIGLRLAPTVRSDSIPDPVTARAMARALLAARSLRQDTLTVTNMPSHLDLDAGDVVARAEATSGTGGRYLIESITYPVGTGYVETSESSLVPLFLSDAAS